MKTKKEKKPHGIVYKRAVPCGIMAVVIFIGEQTTVDVRERRQIRVVILQIGGAVLRAGVQNLEQLHKCLAHTAGVKCGQIVMEHIVTTKDTCILGIQAENKPNTKLVEAF